MAHQEVVTEERYILRSATTKKIYILLGIGILFLVVGLLAATSGGAHDEHGGGHSSLTSNELLASTAVQPESSTRGHEADLHGSPTWLRRLFTTLWMNNVYFTGLGIIGLFFVAIQYAAMAGWSVGVKRVPLAMANWIPISGLLMLVLWFITHHDVFHWTHNYLYQEGEAFDPIINQKAPFFFWPLKAGSFPLFYILRMVIFFGLWYWFFIQIRKNMLSEDLDPSTSYWYKNRVLSTVFLIIFGISSSIAAWDWVMSIDTHWFSTMFGWYVFASWWVTGLAMITLIVAMLKDAGYLKIVNANHLHDLGKFTFAFSIFWTYIWFGQYLLIWYANIPEETVYFIERLRTAPYSWIFYLNLILNFVLPFLLLMPRDAKRQLSMLKLVCPIIIVGHWFDFYNMVTPGIMQKDGGIGFMEIGVALIFLAGFLLVVLKGLTKMPLFGKNDPMLQESLHHHI